VPRLENETWTDQSRKQLPSHLARDRSRSKRVSLTRPGIAVSVLQNERIAHNEVVFREANQRLKSRFDLLVDDEDALLPFLCECGDPACTRVMRLRSAEYVEIHAHPARFAILPGHELAGEQVVSRGNRYEVVEKVGLGLT
jgi:hypothetical protein